MKRIHKNLIIFFFILICTSIITRIIFENYSKSYTIDIVYSNPKMLEDEIEKFISKGVVIKEEIEIKKISGLGDKIYVLFTSQGLIGDAELVSGPNYKYKIVSAGIGTSYLRYHTGKRTRIDDGMIMKDEYVVLLGKNIDMRIDNVQATIGGPKYGSGVSNEEFFIKFCPAPRNYSKSKYPEDIIIRAFDKNEVDITDEIYE